ncbi:MAG: hypothetical protein BWX70_03140 [Verrucomicrobia bacterium ADurb.Bin070]|nr:MAG: hypothetical protein BWX70_03140 [Verrucomicrobia bacterium ADurb.Bin070]
MFCEMRIRLAIKMPLPLTEVYPAGELIPLRISSQLVVSTTPFVTSR